ncbi:MAG: YhdH/YhfP family quinone oxidoreductase [Balneolaceae bacterium]
MRPSIQYKTLVASEDSSGDILLEMKQLSTDDLPDHDVLIRVLYSSLNYKDALSATGNRGVTKTYPHTPGIDAAGIVEYSRDHRFSAGEEVIVTSYDLGMNTPGGFGEYISVPGDWIVPLPDGLTLKESMITGTSGFTAAYGVKKIADQGIKPSAGNVLVSGATGAVGSFAVALLARLGYSVTAATGKTDKHDFLRELGASQVIPRQDVTGPADRPLLPAKWIAAVDTVGGSFLDSILRQIKHNGVVSCCGNILGHELHTSVYPFILRGVSLMGIDSGICLMEDRKMIWELLSTSWKLNSFNRMYREVKPENLPGEISFMLKGMQTGKIVVTLPG